jgi:hypothetical protein
VRFAATEIGLKLHDRIAAPAGHALRTADQKTLEALRQKGAPEELHRLAVLVAALAQMHLSQIGGELGLLIPAAGDRAQAAKFPPECRGGDYDAVLAEAGVNEKRIQAAYPIHPEIFDRLYGDWSTLLKFQRTRGVLRLMTPVIHSLWEKGDHSPLILPSTIPIDEPRVQFELTRYLSDNWVPIIEKDVDGPSSLPLRIDSDVPNLGKLSATRRVARTIGWMRGKSPLRFRSARNRSLNSAATLSGSRVSARRGPSPSLVTVGCVAYQTRGPSW